LEDVGSVPREGGEGGSEGARDVVWVALRVRDANALGVRLKGGVFGVEGHVVRGASGEGLTLVGFGVGVGREERQVCANAVGNLDGEGGDGRGSGVQRLGR
jgi:hypothetical protein